CHIFNLSLESNVCPHTWREAKVKSLPKNAWTLQMRISLEPLSSFLISKGRYRQAETTNQSNKTPANKHFLST
ncbi:hypothetical protein, partial [Microbacterium sp. C7(2022)]|uniref:hypothetical protein n=1 Tax=Microbacterium sp. C7(2022) TaxID=2992759 RepID=UPI00237AD760